MEQTSIFEEFVLLVAMIRHFAVGTMFLHVLSRQSIHFLVKVYTRKQHFNH
jgi:hypothetical protein